jgi:chromosome segregation protein
MKLRTLRLHGFKSFPDRTLLEFRDGVTAIVGSNGCGKSNTADAVRWVLGEQRAGALRSAKMEEVIFQGTVRRRPLNFAEVSLIFSNDDGAVPVPQSEIEITRKVFREGGSEYALNRASCRLRDIHDLLRDTGLGANAYAIIEAGMIDAILSERTDERRALFEEAAGIGKYKDRRRAAQRRLDAAEVDLARLNDLVNEVDSKVRTLARQKRRAERHAEFQARRLALDVAVTRAEVEALAAALEDGARRRGELETQARDAGTDRSTAETVLEERRLEAAELGRKRADAARSLDELRQRLDAREREILLADERRSHAELRIAQLVRERAELAERAAAQDAEAARLTGEREGAAGRLETVRTRLEARLEENEGLRTNLSSHRQASEAAAARAHDLAREIAAAEGERAAAGRRRDEAHERIEHLAEQEQQLAAEIAVLDEQTELWSGQGDTLRDRLDATAAAAEQARERVSVLRAREAALRDQLRAAEDRLSRLDAQVAAREALERSYEGFSPAVAALMAQRERFPGVLGPLADFVRATTADEETAAAVESYLGSLIHAVVVRDLDAARAVRRWFRETWDGGGTLLLLPLDAPAVRQAAAAADGHRLGVTGTGAAEPWVHTFLAGLEVVDGEHTLAAYTAGGARVDPLGDTVDPRGVIRLGQPPSGEGILARREALGRLRNEAEDARVAHDRLGLERAAVAGEVADADDAAREADELRRVTESELRQLDADSAAHGQRQGRLHRERDETSAAMAAARRHAVEASEQIAVLDARLTELQARANEAGAETARTSAALAGLDGTWERARDEESELRVAAARAEAELRELERAHAAAVQGADAARARSRTLEAEADELRRSLEGLSGVRERAGHPVNMLAVEEHAEEDQRGASRKRTFLLEQRDDLTRARDDLVAAIRQINRTAREVFMSTFDTVRENFRRTFQSLFQGGECDVWLADPDDPLESPSRSRPLRKGKKTQRIHLLSGGERTLTALALLFALYLVKPRPSACSTRSTRRSTSPTWALHPAAARLQGETQFIVITHNPRTMEAADWVYGVTMEEPGVSDWAHVRARASRAISSGQTATNATPSIVISPAVRPDAANPWLATVIRACPAITTYRFPVRR